MSDLARLMAVAHDGEVLEWLGAQGGGLAPAGVESQVELGEHHEEVELEEAAVP